MWSSQILIKDLLRSAGPWYVGRLPHQKSVYFEVPKQNTQNEYEKTSSTQAQNMKLEEARQNFVKLLSSWQQPELKMSGNCEYLKLAFNLIEAVIFQKKRWLIAKTCQS